MSHIQNVSDIEGNYIAGFTDGEGSFNISFKIRPDYKNGFQIYPSFNISQKELKILSWIKSKLQTGTIRSRGDGVHYYEVHNLESLKNIIIPFFKRYRNRSERKLKQFNIFVQIISILEKSITRESIIQIFNLREEIQVGRERKYTLDEILRIFDEKSSETT